MTRLILFTMTLDEFREFLISILQEELQKAIPEPTKPEDYLTRQEVSALLKISFPTLSGWTKRGLLKSYRISNGIRYKRSEIETALKEVRNIKYRREVRS